MERTFITSRAHENFSHRVDVDPERSLVYRKFLKSLNPNELGEGVRDRLSTHFYANLDAYVAAHVEALSGLDESYSRATGSDDMDMPNWGGIAFQMQRHTFGAEFRKQVVDNFEKKIGKVPDDYEGFKQEQSEAFNSAMGVLEGFESPSQDLVVALLEAGALERAKQLEGALNILGGARDLDSFALNIWEALVKDAFPDARAFVFEFELVDKEPGSNQKRHHGKPSGTVENLKLVLSREPEALRHELPLSIKVMISHDVGLDTPVELPVGDK